MKHSLTLFRHLALLVVVGLLAACGKEKEDLVSGTAGVLFTNAALAVPSLDAYVDNIKVSAVPITYGTTSGFPGSPYLSVNAGLRFISLSPDGSNNLVQGNIPLASDAAYSVFAYDTVNAAGTLRVLLLTDNLTPPTPGKSHIRYVQLSPDTGRIDIRLTNTTDTISYNAQTYVPTGTATEASLAVFRVVNPGNYNITIKNSSGITPPLSVPVTLADGKIYTIYSRGKKSNGYGTTTGFNISTVTHN
ncbi:MAG: DUF4397 domain-containing protein [Chitinophagaceae bacterium]|nr:MAG: DUF4397 domain-containing protein [Chitinophagaceae bacterium]